MVCCRQYQATLKSFSPVANKKLGPSLGEILCLCQAQDHGATCHCYTSFAYFIAHCARDTLLLPLGAPEIVLDRAVICDDQTILGACMCISILFVLCHISFQLVMRCPGKSHWRASCSSRGELHQLTKTQLQLPSVTPSLFAGSFPRRRGLGQELAKNYKSLTCRNMHRPYISIEGMLLNLYHRH